MKNFSSLFLLLSVTLLVGCATPYPWPQTVPTESRTETSPRFSQSDLALLPQHELLEKIAGRYAHYDVVAYEDANAKPIMRTFIISYGFTEFFVKDSELIERDRFCHAEHKLNFKTVSSSFNDAATQAIVPKDQKVEVTLKNGQWHLFRPATPTLLGVKGDPLEPLPRDKNDEDFIDADGDGKPGVTVDLRIAKFIKGKIYLTRREIFENHMVVENENHIAGYVRDASEQFVIGANLKILAKPSDPAQLPEPHMNPIILVRVDDAIATCDQLMANRDALFPVEPEFY